MSAKPLIDLLFPPRCPLCGKGLAAQDGLCPECWQGLSLPGAPACALCQRPLPSEEASHSPDHLLCAPCVAQPPLHQGVAAATVYNETSRRLVVSLKHGRRVALAPFMGRLMAARLGPHSVGPEWIIVPVPLHRWRLWGRGFNQSGLLGREIAQSTGARLIVDALTRRRRTPMLMGMGGDERARILAGAIAANPRHRAALHGAKVILADDVLTSGATTNACIKALQAAGVQSVILACFARVVGDSLP
jgi:ComF family protein